MPKRTPGAAWISRREAAERLGVHITSVDRIVQAGGEIRTQQYPGLSVKYRAEDVDRLARESVTTVTRETAPATGLGRAS